MPLSFQAIAGAIIGSVVFAIGLATWLRDRREATTADSLFHDLDARLTNNAVLPKAAALLEAARLANLRSKPQKNKRPAD